MDVDSFPRVIFQQAGFFFVSKEVDDYIKSSPNNGEAPKNSPYSVDNLDSPNVALWDHMGTKILKVFRTFIKNAVQSQGNI